MVMGLEAMTRGENEEALDQYRNAIRIDPERADAHRAAGLAAARSGRTGEALRAFERYLALAPEAPDGDAIRARIVTLRAQNPRQ